MGPGDLLHRRRDHLHGAGEGIDVDLVRSVPGAVVEIAAALLGHHHGGDLRHLERCVVAGRLGAQRQAGVPVQQQVRKPVALAVGGGQGDALAAQAAQHVDLDIADDALALLFTQRRHIGAGAFLPAFLIGEADKAQLRVRGQVLDQLGHSQHGRHARSVVIGPVSRRHAVVVGRDHQDVGLVVRRRLHRDDRGAAAARIVGISLGGDLIAHGGKAPLEILGRIPLAVGTDGPGLGAQRLQIRGDLLRVRQQIVTLQHRQRLRRGDGGLRGEGAAGTAGKQAGPGTPHQGVFRPRRCRAGVGKGFLQIALHRRRTRQAVEHCGELLPRDGGRRQKLSVPRAPDDAFRRRPGHCRIVRRICKGRWCCSGGTARRFIEQLHRLQPGQHCLGAVQEGFVDLLRLGPGAAIGRPFRPVRRKGGGGQNAQAQKEGKGDLKTFLHGICLTIAYVDLTVGFYLSISPPDAQGAALPAKRFFILLFRRLIHRYRPVTLSGVCAICWGVPAATSRPPASPPPGPISIT